MSAPVFAERLATTARPGGYREWIGVRTERGRVIHWFDGATFDGVWSLRSACGLSQDFAVDRDGGDFGPRLDDYCTRCDAALVKWVNA